MYGEIAAIFVSFVSFVPFVFKTCTRVWRSYLQTRSYLFHSDFKRIREHPPSFPHSSENRALTASA
jgi:hypothetical protein